MGDLHVQIDTSFMHDNSQLQSIWQAWELNIPKGKGDKLLL